MSLDQEILRVLRDAPNQRRVLLTRRGGSLLATRFFLQPVKLAFDGLVGQATVAGEGSIGGLPEEVALALEGYRVRAALGGIFGLPKVVSAGVTADPAAGLPDAGAGAGYAYVSTEFVAGQTVAEVGDGLGSGEKVALLRRLLRLLHALHDRGVVYGDLKPQNVIAVGEEPWLIDLDTMRRVPGPGMAIPTRDLTVAYAAPEQTRDHTTFLASDVYSFGRLASRLLEGELGGAPPSQAASTWEPLLARSLADDPAARPTARELLEELGGEGDSGEHDAAATVPVQDLIGQDSSPQSAAGEPSGRGAAGGAAGEASGDGASGEASGDGASGEASGGGASGEASGGGASGEASGSGASGEASGGGASGEASGGSAAGAGAAARREEGDASGPGAAASGGGREGGRPETHVIARPPRERRPRRAGGLGRRGWAVLALVTAALIPAGAVVLYVSGAAGAGSGAAGAGPDAALPPDARPPDAGPAPFRACEEGAIRAVLAEIAEGDPIPEASQILSWFSGLAADEVGVYRLRDDDGEHRIAFEVSEASWPGWRAAARGEGGEELCRKIGRELADREAGPPRGPYRSREHDVVFAAERREGVAGIDKLGDLRDIADGAAYAGLLDWLDPLDVAEPRCRARGGWVRDHSLEIDCRVANPRRELTPVGVAASMIPEGGDEVERVRHTVLEPGESVEASFEFEEFDDRGDTYCECNAFTIP